MPSAPDKSIYLVCGDDEFRVEKAAKEIVQSLLSKKGGFLERIDGRVKTVADTLKVLRAVRDALISDGLFGGGASVIWLKSPSFISEEAVSRNEEVKKHVENLLANAAKGFAQDASLIVSTVKINRSQTFFKRASSIGHVKDFGSNLKPRAREEAAYELLGETLESLSIEMGPGEKRAFVGRVGCDSRELVSETEKLAAYLGFKGRATITDIGEIASKGAQSEIWALTDAFARRDGASLLKEAAFQMKNGSGAIAIASILLSSVTELLSLKDAVEKGWARPAAGGLDFSRLPESVSDGLDLAERDIRSLGSFRLRKLMECLPRWKLGELSLAREQILLLREELVSGQLPEAFLLDLHLLKAIGKSQ